MNRNFLFFCAAAVLVALAACGKGDEGGEQAADTGKGPSVRQAAAPAETAPAKKGPNLVETLRENSGVMTPEEKAAAVARARANAESAAKAVGQGDAEAQSAAEAAAGAAQKSLDERQPQ